MILTECCSYDYNEYLYTRDTIQLMMIMIIMMATMMRVILCKSIYRLVSLSPFILGDFVVYGAGFCCVCIHIIEEPGYID